MGKRIEKNGTDVHGTVMKICFISNLYPPYILGGAEISVKRIAEKFSDLGHDVIVITSSPNGKDQIDVINNVKVHRIKTFNVYPAYVHHNQNSLKKVIWHMIDLWNPYVYLVTKKILSREKPDIVHIHNYKGLSLSIFKAAKDLNLPLIFTLHDYSLLCLRANLVRSGNLCSNPNLLCKTYNRIQKFLIAGYPDLILTPSRYVQGIFQASGIFNHREIRSLPHGIDILKERPVKDLNVINILYVGTIDVHKGYQVLVDAFSKLNCGDARLHIVGKGPYQRLLREQLQSDPRIHCYGYVTDDELWTLYRMANVLVVPSIWPETFGLVILEGLKHGMPVIASNIGAYSELIIDNYNGFLFSPGSTAELRQILSSLIENRDKLLDFGENAFESSQKYDMIPYMKALCQTYQTLITSKRS